MATTSAALVATALECLEAGSVDYAFLHGEGLAASETLTSDTDLVVDRHVEDVARLLVEQLPSRGLHPVLWLPYDVAAGALFVCTGDAMDGIQLDLVGDPGGRGKYGFRSNQLLSRAERGARWRTVDPLDETLYLIRKRQVKGDFLRLQAAVDQSFQWRNTCIESRAHEVFPPRVATAVIKSVATGGRHHYRSPRSVAWHTATVLRLSRRVACPAGAWVEVEAEHAAKQVADRFARFLVCARVSPRPTSARGEANWWIRNVVRIRWRGGLIVSFPCSSRGPRFQPDIRLRRQVDGDSATAEVVDGLADRLRAQLYGR